MRLQPVHAHIENLLRNFKQPATQQRVALPNKDGYEFADVRTIIFCEAKGAYSRVHLQGRMPVLISRSLGDMEEMLPEEMFQRIHHSTIVNLSFVSHYIRGDGGYVKMASGEQLPVSKSRKDALMTRLGLR